MMGAYLSIPGLGLFTPIDGEVVYFNCQVFVVFVSQYETKNYSGHPVRFGEG